MTNEYKLGVISKAIAKFEAIPAEDICSFAQFNPRTGQRCFIGHYGTDKLKIVTHSAWRDMIDLSSCAFSTEAEEVAVVLCEYLDGVLLLYKRNTRYSLATMAELNNGNNEHYKQPTEKERILAGLRDVKKKLELIIYPPVDQMINNIIETKSEISNQLLVAL